MKGGEPISSAQGGWIIALLALLLLVTYSRILFFDIPQAVHHDAQNFVKVECFLHADDAKVHQFCVDRGYDR